MNKKKGFTLLEIIISIAIMSLILTMTFAIFSNVSKANSELKIKSTLQTEAQNISRNIVNSGMESSGIIGITLADGSVIQIGGNTEEKYGDLTFVDSNNNVDSGNPQNNKWISIQKITINNRYERVMAGGIQETDDTPFTISYDKVPQGTLTIEKEKFDGTKTPIGTVKSTVSEDINSIVIQPGNVFNVDGSGKLTKNTEEKISNASAIEININLSKKMGTKDIIYSVPITITFRNKTAS